MRIITFIAALGITLGATMTSPAAQIVIGAATVAASAPMSDAELQAAYDAGMAELTPAERAEIVAHSHFFAEGVSCFLQDYPRLDDPMTAIDVMVETIVLHCLLEADITDQHLVSIEEIQGDIINKLGQLFGKQIMLHRAEARAGG